MENYNTLVKIEEERLAEEKRELERLRGKKSILVRIRKTNRYVLSLSKSASDAQLHFAKSLIEELAASRIVFSEPLDCPANEAEGSAAITFLLELRRVLADSAFARSDEIESLVIDTPSFVSGMVRKDVSTAEADILVRPVFVGIPQEDPAAAC